MIWPPDLPCYPIQGTWTEKRQDNVVRYQPEVGNAKARRRFTAATTLATGSWKFTAAQYRNFEAFFADDLKDGSLPFSMRHPLNDALYTWSFEEPPEVSETTRQAIVVTFSLRRAF